MTDFIDELEKSISNVGASTVWKRKIGETTLWFSPITLYGQEKVTEFLNSADDASIAVIHETKRMSLSHAIVGINEHDLRPYKEGTPALPITGRDGKPTKVSLDKYLHAKIINWSAQFVDDAFSVYADLIESLQKKNLEDIKFENTKSPEEELSELEERVATIRLGLGKPPLVEMKMEEVQESVSPTEQESKPLPGEAVEVSYDPFAKIADKTSQLVASSVTPQSTVVQEPSRPDFAPKNSPLTVQDLEEPESSSSVQVIDNRATVTRSAPMINEAVLNRNPMFNPGKR